MLALFVSFHVSAADDVVPEPAQMYKRHPNVPDRHKDRQSCKEVCGDSRRKDNEDWNKPVKPGGKTLKEISEENLKDCPPPYNQGVKCESLGFGEDGNKTDYVCLCSQFNFLSDYDGANQFAKYSDSEKMRLYDQLSSALNRLSKSSKNHIRYHQEEINGANAELNDISKTLGDLKKSNDKRTTKDARAYDYKGKERQERQPAGAQIGEDHNEPVWHNYKKTTKNETLSECKKANSGCTCTFLRREAEYDIYEVDCP